MKVEEMKLDKTAVKFYDDFTGDNFENINFKCFENALRLMVERVLMSNAAYNNKA